jgi:hypothetical protein
MFIFWQYGLHACEVGAVLLEPHLQPFHGIFQISLLNHVSWAHSVFRLSIFTSR